MNLSQPVKLFYPQRIASLAFLFLLSVTCPAAPPAPKGEDLDAIVRDVLTRNPELRFYEAELAAARGERRSAGRWVNPELGTQVGQKRSTDPNSVLQGEGVAWSVAVSQTFEWPGRLALRKSIADRQVALAENGIAGFRAALAARAQILAYDVAITRRRAETTLEAADRFLALQEVAVQRDPAGVAPLIETRILEANSITYRKRAAEALQGVQRAILELNQLRGEPLSNNLHVIVGPLVFNAQPGLAELLSAALTNNFELRQRTLELEQQGYRVALSRNERFPTVTLSPYFTQENAAGRDQFAGVGISLPLPLWNRNQGTIHASTAREEQAQSSLKVAQRMVERKIIELATAYDSRLEEMSHWRPDSVERFQEAAELSDRHYRLGAVPISTYVEMQKQSLDALDTLLETRREAMDAALQLDLITGLHLGLLTSGPAEFKPAIPSVPVSGHIPSLPSHD